MATYPATFEDPTGTRDVLTGEVSFTDPANQPVPPSPPVTSGSLPNLGAWVSGTAKQNPVAYQVSVAIDFVTDGTANIATCAVEVSPDGTTYTTLSQPGCSAAVNTVGALTFATAVTLPAGWFLKLVFSHGTPAVSVYY